MDGNDKNSTDKLAHGFKLMINQISDPWILEEIKQKDYKVIMLCRKNKFSQCIFQRNSCKKIGNKILVDRKNLTHRIHQFINNETNYSHIADMIFSYEELTNNNNISKLGNEKIRSSLISLLGINDGSFSANLKKKERKSYSELLANYEEITDLEQKYSNHIPVFKNTKNTAIII